MAWPRRLAWSITVTDAAAITIALLIAQLGRFGTSGVELDLPLRDASYPVVGLLIGSLWMTSLSALRTRELRILNVRLVEYQRVLNATLWTFGVLAIVAFLAKVDVARGYLAIALPIGLVLLFVGRASWRAALIKLRRAGRCLTGAIIVGPADDVRRVALQLSTNLRAGYRAIGAVVTDGGDLSDLTLSVPTVSVDDLATVSRRTRTRAVMIAGNLPGGHEQIRDLGWQLENSNVELILLSRLTDVAGPRMHLRLVDDLPMVHVDLPQYSGFNHAVKRLIDVVATSMALMLLAPVFAVVSIAIRFSSSGPVLFRQARVGVRGGQFTMIKFRTMIPDAEAHLEALLRQSDGNGVMFKMKEDPRVTGVGRVLRRFSLDELPQLWNVLRGDMSLIGPRPPLPSEVAQYEGQVSRRLLIKPGITGLWQVSGRSNLSWEESVKLDLYYVENWSVTGDLIILLRTIRAVLRRDGAY